MAAVACELRMDRSIQLQRPARIKCLIAELWHGVCFRSKADAFRWLKAQCEHRGLFLQTVHEFYHVIDPVSDAEMFVRCNRLVYSDDDHDFTEAYVTVPDAD